MRMYLNGIIIDVPPSDMTFYSRAGYVVLEDEVAEDSAEGSVEEEAAQKTEEPAVEKPKGWVNPLDKKKGAK